MSSARTVRDYTRIVPSTKGPVLECAVIRWPHPHESERRWVKVRTLDAGATEAEMMKARRALLDEPKWFGKCTYCKEWSPEGCMHEPGVCQGCAEAVLGVDH